MRTAFLLAGAVLLCATSCPSAEPPHPIYQAIRDGDLESVKALLKADPKAGQPGDPIFHHLPPLPLAASHGKMEIMKFLIASGANVNEVEPQRRGSPLHAAVYFKSKEAVELLLKSGADVNLVVKADSELWTPLSEAVTTDIAALLVAAGARVNDGRALYHAIVKSHDECPEEVAIFLLGKGADPNAEGVMCSAARSRSVKLMETLLAKGGNPNKGIAFKGKYSPLSEACEPKQIDVAKLLIEHGADVNARGEWDYTPLRAAAGAGNDPLIELLLAKGANIDAIKNDENRPIHEAIFRRHTKTAQLLASKGAKLDAVAYAALGKTAELKLALADDPQLKRIRFSNGHWPLLHIAAAHDQAECAEALLQAGADPQALAASGDFTALHIAAERGSPAVTKVLLSHHASVAARTSPHMYSSGARTPLLTAAAKHYFDPYSEGHDEVIGQLIAAGADVNAEGEDRWTALDWARKEKHQAAVDMLLKAGAKPGTSPLNKR